MADFPVSSERFDPYENFEFRISPAMLDLIARKALARSISDIAAMGGSPTAALATVCLPLEQTAPDATSEFELG